MRPHAAQHKILFGVFVAIAFALGGTAQATQAATGTIRVEVLEAGRPLEGVAVSAGSASAVTDASGVARLTVPSGPVSVKAAKDGYDLSVVPANVVAGQQRILRLAMTPKVMEQEQATIVTSTRNNRRIEDQARPMEVLGRAKVEEEMLMMPGNVAALLDGMPSLRLQSTSPELGTEMIRIRGLRGQYTRLLLDGVPLYFDQAGGLTTEQVSPMDFGQVEVLPGGASPLFGANALSGGVNLLSLRPGKNREREFLFSQSMQGATDGVVRFSRPQSGSWSSTYVFGGSRQSERDADDDGWSDIPGYSRGIARTHVLWANGRGRSASGTAGATFEQREGGSAIAHQSLDSRGADGALFGQMPLGKYVLAGAGTLFVQSRTRQFSDGTEHERRESATIEITLRGTAPRQTWLAGIATDWFTIRSKDPVSSAYLSTRPGLFVHDDVDVAPWLTVSGSARVDHHNIYGLFLSPGGSALVRGGPWSARISADRSYNAPMRLTEETEAAGQARLLIPAQPELETSRSVSGDVSYTTRAAAMTFSVFNTHIDHPALIDRATYTLYTDPNPVLTHGIQILGTARRTPFAVTGTYAYISARERGGIEVALTPRHAASVAVTAEENGRGRVGVQVHFTGAQRLDANPYRSASEPYVVVNVLGERPFGRWQLFANAENVTNVHQTHWDPIARPTRDVDGRWTVDAWAPLRGRVINVGVKVSF